MELPNETLGATFDRCHSVFYTESGRGERVISAVAVKDLTPLTVGLGDKSLVILGPSHDLGIAPSSIMFRAVRKAHCTRKSKF